MTGKSAKSTAQQSVSGAQASSPTTPTGAVLSCPASPTNRVVNGIVMKRKHISLKGDDRYGHWWMEIDGRESYGWWPKTSVGRWDTLSGIDGELNGQTTFGGSPTRDPHHGDPAEDMFAPVVAANDRRTDAQIKDCLRGFARSYTGEWRWTFGAGQNCHTFQEAAMKHCGLSEP